jgi:hypothetical protein
MTPSCAYCGRKCKKAEQAPARKLSCGTFSPHKKVSHNSRHIDDSLERLNRRTPCISDHHPGTGVAAQQDGEQVLACHEVHKGRMMIERDQGLPRPLGK